MRKRFPISTHLEFPAAQLAKREKQIENPDKHYQIRKFKNGFRLVERLTATEAQVIQEARKPKKKKFKAGSTYAG